jgi:uncharacterized damage-inducible protein DinB
MMIDYGGKELAASFRTVRNNTIQVAEDIPDSKYGFKAAPDIRSVGQTLVHIAMGPIFQMHVHQNRFDDLTKVNFPELMAKVTAEEAKPRSKAEIIAFLKAEGEKFASYLESLPDSFLAERVTMPTGAQPQGAQPSGAQPATRSRFEMLLSPKEHEMHHRGQLMLVERIIGLVPHLTRERMAGQAQAREAQAREAQARG